MSMGQTNIDICNILGLDPNKVTRIDIFIRDGEWPEVVAHMIPSPGQLIEVVKLTNAHNPAAAD